MRAQGDKILAVDRTALKALSVAVALGASEGRDRYVFTVLRDIMLNSFSPCVACHVALLARAACRMGMGGGRGRARGVRRAAWGR